MNIVFIMTDTQNTDSIFAYGNQHAQTPNIDALCRRGVRFDRAYTACPLCTPARGAIFSGMVPATNGATYNDATPFRDIPLMGTLFADRGFRVGYTGKWHLDG
ncbi:MAG: sulfatase-like hydrolase/transferase, partial [Chitinivibrionales bacterium]|nr:sulfatase-like hydrolase/transferase [Chitinivibrionales bacterium]